MVATMIGTAATQSVTDPMVRAYSARACGKKIIKSALPSLRTMIVEDRHWLARAEAAVACGIMKDGNAFEGMRKLVAEDPAEKTQLAGMDALGLLGSDGQTAIPMWPPICGWYERPWMVHGDNGPITKRWVPIMITHEVSRDPLTGLDDGHGARRWIEARLRGRSPDRSGPR